jgi:hypothetical protein
MLIRATKLTEAKICVLGFIAAKPNTTPAAKRQYMTAETTWARI